MPLHVIACYMYNEHDMEQFITLTLYQIPWIIISKAYNLHSFMLIYITPMYQLFTTHSACYKFSNTNTQKSSTQTSHSRSYSALEIIWTRSRNFSFCFICYFTFFEQISRLSLTGINSAMKQSSNSAHKLSRKIVLTSEN